MAVDSRKVVNGTQYLELQEPQVKTKPSTRKRRQKKDFTLALMRLSVVVLMIIFVISMAYVLVEARVTRLNWEIHEQVKQNKDIMMDNEKLRLEIAKKSSLDRVESLAAQDLGMVEASDIEFLIISENETPLGSLKEKGESIEERSDTTNSWLDRFLHTVTLLKSQYIQIGKGVTP